MSSLISTIPPTDLLIKHETNNGSPHLMSNISSPNTGSNFSLVAQQQKQQQQQQQQQQAFTTNNNVSTGNNANNFLSFFNNSGNVSPSEGSTVSDSNNFNNNNITSNIPVTNSSISSGQATNINSTISVNSALAEDDFAAGIGTSTTYNNNLGFSASSASSNSSTINSGNSSVCGVTNGGNIMQGIILNNNSSNMMGNNNNVNNNNNNFASNESSLKQQQFSLMPQQFIQQQQQQQQQQHKFHQQQQQQRNFNALNEISSDNSNNNGSFSMQLGINSSQSFSSENSTACYSMPQSAPSFSQTIRNPFEEEEQLSSLKNQRSMSAKPGNMCATSSSGSPLSSPSYFEHFRNQRRQMMPDLPQFNPGSYPPGSREHQLALERYRLPYTFYANQRRQLACPYPLPGIGPNGQQMNMMLRFPPSYMNPALMNGGGAVNGKMPFFGIPGSHMVMTLGGPVLVGPNGQAIGAPRPSSIGTPQQQSNGCPTPGSNNNAPLTKKEPKKRETKLTKKQQQVLQQQQQQQQQAEADAIRQQQHLHQQQQQQQQASCAMMNNLIMSRNNVGVPPQISMIDNGNNGNCSLTPNELKQRLQHQNAMQQISGALSPNHFKMLGRPIPFQRSAKLYPMQEQRIPETGDCTVCKQKINQQRRGIRCTAMSQGCGLCYHTDCAQLSQVAYNEFFKDYRIEWICQSCTQRKTICFDI